MGRLKLENDGGSNFKFNEPATGLISLAGKASYKLLTHAIVVVLITF